MNQVARDFKFNATLKPRLDIEIEDWWESQPHSESNTVFIESNDPGDTPLGGSMSIHYDWDDERETDPTD